MSDEQGRRIISLIPKPSKDNTLEKNYHRISHRISLFSVEYKIAEKALASRTQNILSTIISLS